MSTISSELLQRLRLVYDNVSIRDAKDILIDGQVVTNDALGQGVDGSDFRGTERELYDRLVQTLYLFFYSRPFTGIAGDPMRNTNPNTLISALKKANPTSSELQGGWVVKKVGQGGTITAVRHDLVADFGPGSYIVTDSHLPVVIGSECTVAMPRGSTTRQPAFYYVYGETPSDAEEELPRVRFYWNVKAERAAAWISILGDRLNNYFVPFLLKVVHQPGAFERTDNAVLYVGDRYFHITAMLISASWSDLCDLLKPEVPMFVKKLAPGLGVAEDPGNNVSFGFSRCSMLARALLRAEGESGNFEAFVGYLKEAMRAEGLDISKPHLNAGSKQIYELPQL